ncbi:hypothetical protein KL943_005368 [Ogataea angusta]|nr:hypothetical protein KL943_005368 [Ogataea angusta]
MSRALSLAVTGALDLRALGAAELAAVVLRRPEPILLPRRGRMVRAGVFARQGTYADDFRFQRLIQALNQGVRGDFARAACRDEAVVRQFVLPHSQSRALGRSADWRAQLGQLQKTEFGRYVAQLVSSADDEEAERAVLRLLGTEYEFSHTAATLDVICRYLYNRGKWREVVAMLDVYSQWRKTPAVATYNRAIAAKRQLRHRDEDDFESWHARRPARVSGRDVVQADRRRVAGGARRGAGGREAGRNQNRQKISVPQLFESALFKAVLGTHAGAQRATVGVPVPGLDADAAEPAAGGTVGALFPATAAVRDLERGGSNQLFPHALRVQSGLEVRQAAGDQAAVQRGARTAAGHTSAESAVPRVVLAGPKRGCAQLCEKVPARGSRGRAAHRERPRVGTGRDGHLLACRPDGRAAGRRAGPDVSRQVASSGQQCIQDRYC